MGSEREKFLYEVADRGLLFQSWIKDPATVWLIEHLKDEAQVAREQCGRLSPYTETAKLADAQLDVRAYETLIQKIDRIVQVGISAERELEHPDGFPDQ